MVFGERKRREVSPAHNRRVRVLNVTNHGQHWLISEFDVTFCYISTYEYTKKSLRITFDRHDMVSLEVRCTGLGIVWRGHYGAIRNSKARR